MGNCTVENCESISVAKGLCNKHWKRMKRIGSLDLPERKLTSIAESNRSHFVSNQKWKQKNHKKVLCHKKVNRAKASGKLVSGSCEKCGSTKSIAHHHDYNNPLSVQWLCPSCHVKLHREKANKEKGGISHGERQEEDQAEQKALVA